MQILLLIALVFAVAGFFVGRWRFVLIPLVAWPAFFLFAAVFGNGLGDGWWFGFVLATATSAAGALAGVAARVFTRAAQTATR